MNQSKTIVVRAFNNSVICPVGLPIIDGIAVNSGDFVLAYTQDHRFIPDMYRVCRTTWSCQDIMQDIHNTLDDIYIQEGEIYANTYWVYRDKTFRQYMSQWNEEELCVPNKRKG